MAGLGRIRHHRRPAARGRLVSCSIRQETDGHDPRASQDQGNREGEPRMDTEQIRREMSSTRASIDHRLDLLAARTTNVKREAMQGAVDVILISAAVTAGIW